MPLRNDPQECIKLGFLECKKGKLSPNEWRMLSKTCINKIDNRTSLHPRYMLHCLWNIFYILYGAA